MSTETVSAASRRAHERPTLTEVTFKAVKHIHLGRHETTSKDLTDVDLVTWERLHAPFNRISPAELVRQIEIFRMLGWKARQKQDNVSQSYLLGVMDGLMNSAVKKGYSVRSLHSASRLTELFSDAEASVMMTAAGLSGFDKAPKNLPYCLGRLKALDYTSGRTAEAIPSRVPHVPAHLK